MSNIRRAARIGLPVLFASMALGAPAAVSAAPPVNQGTWHNDFIVGTPDPDIIFGRGGADIIFGLPGDDILYGNLGPDRIFGGKGADFVYGGQGADTLRGGADADGISGGPGDDLVLAAGDGAIDRIRCGPGRLDLAIVDPDDVVSDDCEYIWVRDPEV